MGPSRRVGRYSQFQVPGFPSSTDALGILAGVVTIAGVFFGAIRPRARVTDIKPILRYIDYETNQLVEEKEYVFSWAHLLGFLIKRRVTLPKFDRNTALKVYCKPPISFKQNLPNDYYELSTKKKHQFIHLEDREYFENQEMDRIWVQCNSLQGEAYRANIVATPAPGCVIIENRNREEVRNYHLTIPGARFEDVLDLLRYGAEAVVPPEPARTEDQTAVQGIEIRVKKIGAMEGDTPGRVTIVYGNSVPAS